MITSGKGKYKVWLEQRKIGEDIIYILGGGERSHIGGIVFCEPNKEPQIISLKGHYDDIVLTPIVKEACKKYKVKVIAIGGIHVNNASQEEINTLVTNCRELVKFI